MDAELVFYQAGLPGFGKLYEYIKNKGVAEIGSSSIGERYSDDCSHVHNVMRAKVGILSNDAEDQAAYHSIGDKSAVLNLIGWKNIDGVMVKVTSKEYLELFASHLHFFDKDVLMRVDIIFRALGDSIIQIFSEKIFDGNGGIQ